MMAQVPGCRQPGDTHYSRNPGDELHVGPQGRRPVHRRRPPGRLRRCPGVRQPQVLGRLAAGVPGDVLGVQVRTVEPLPPGALFIVRSTAARAPMILDERSAALPSLRRVMWMPRPHCRCRGRCRGSKTAQTDTSCLSRGRRAVLTSAALLVVGMRRPTVRSLCPVGSVQRSKAQMHSAR